MRLYLVRHGKYLTPDKDCAKSLSPEGISQTKIMVEFLKKLKVGTIWHSNKKRAVQTVEILSESLGGVEAIVTRADLGPADSVNRFPELINEFNKDLMIVGHNPFLQKLATQLLESVSHFESLHLPNSGVVCLEYKEAWRVVWSINPDLITRQ